MALHDEAVEIRHADQILALLIHRLRLTDDPADLPQAALDLLLEIHCVVHDAKVRMGAPGAEGVVVELDGVSDVLGAGVVAEVIGKLRALGAGDEVDHSVVLGKHCLGGQTEVGDDVLKFRVGDIGLVVEQGAVIENQDVLLRDLLRGVERQLLLVELVGNDEILEIEHGHAVVKGLDAEAGDQLRGGFRDRDDLPAVLLLELLEHTADQGRFAGRRAAGQDDFDDFLLHEASAFPLEYDLL